jgi:hypothetical protein
MIEEMDHAFAAANADDKVRVIILGAGRRHLLIRARYRHAGGKGGPAATSISEGGAWRVRAVAPPVP